MNGGMREVTPSRAGRPANDLQNVILRFARVDASLLNVHRLRRPFRGAKCRTAQNAERRRRATRRLSSFGISRLLALRAVRHLAPYGIRRRLAFRAVTRCLSIWPPR